MSNFITWLLARLKEPSTITTLVALIAGAVGVQLSPENTTVIVSAVGGIVSLIAMFWGQDYKSPPPSP